MRKRLEQPAFILLLLVVSLLFVMLMRPFWGAIFWACAITIIFNPMQKWLTRRLGNKPNRVALLTLFICMVIVVLTIIFISMTFIQ